VPAPGNSRARFAKVIMSRFLVSIVVVLVVVIGALFLLAGRATERPQTRVEKPVSLANLQG
jgi:hypothetical protein